MIRLEMRCDRCSFAEAYSLSGYEDVAVFLTAKGWGGEWREEKYFDLCPACSRGDGDPEDVTLSGYIQCCDAWAYREAYWCRIFEELRDGTTRAIHEVIFLDGTVVVPPIDPSDYTRKTVELWIDHRDSVDGRDCITRDYLESLGRKERLNRATMEMILDASKLSLSRPHAEILPVSTRQRLMETVGAIDYPMVDPGAVPPPEVKILSAPKYLIQWDKPTLMFPNQIILATPILPAPEPPYPPRSTITGPDLNPDSAGG